MTYNASYIKEINKSHKVVKKGSSIVVVQFLIGVVP
jgi:hypothetical protein